MELLTKGRPDHHSTGGFLVVEDRVCSHGNFSRVVADRELQFLPHSDTPNSSAKEAHRRFAVVCAFRFVPQEECNPSCQASSKCAEPLPVHGN